MVTVAQVGTVCRVWGRERESGRLGRAVRREVVTRRKWVKADIWTDT